MPMFIDALRSAIERAMPAPVGAPISPPTQECASYPETFDRVSQRTGNDDLEMLEPPEPRVPDTRDHYICALRKAKGNVSKAARLLGIGRATMYRKMKRFNISKDNVFR